MRPSYAEYEEGESAAAAAKGQVPQTAYPEKRQTHQATPGAQAAASLGDISAAQPPVPQPEGSKPEAQLPEGQQLMRRTSALEPGSVVKERHVVSDPAAIQPVRT